MSRHLNAHRLNMKAFAHEGAALVESTPLPSLERLALEAHELPSGAAASWEARGELRPSPGAEDAIWLHLKAHAVVPLTCQRCMAAVATPLHVDQWFRFVDSEDIAMAEDDQSEEDLLVMEPQFDLLALVEDELVMALPLVPMHEHCPNPPVLSAGDDEIAVPDTEKPNPFAVLAQLKGKK